MTSKKVLLKLTGMEDMFTFVTMEGEEDLTYGKTVNMYFFLVTGT